MSDTQYATRNAIGSTTTKFTGGQIEIVVETLVRESVPYIVGISGHGTAAQ